MPPVIISWKFFIIFAAMRTYLCNIFALFLSLVIIYCGTGVAFVHICSSYCQTQKEVRYESCQKAQTAVEGGCHTTKQACCHHKVFTSSCACLDIAFQIDYYYQASCCSSLSVTLFPVETLFSIVRFCQPQCELLLSLQGPNAPPQLLYGRTLLALHSMLII